MKTPRLFKVIFGNRYGNDQGDILGHTLLRNPFELPPEATQGTNHGTNRGTSHGTSLKGSRATPICSRCQSDDITCSATVQWSNESQEWQLANTFDLPAHCNSCSSACELTWLPLN